MIKAGSKEAKILEEKIKKLILHKKSTIYQDSPYFSQNGFETGIAWDVLHQDKEDVLNFLLEETAVLIGDSNTIGVI